MKRVAIHILIFILALLLGFGAGVLTGRLSKGPKPLRSGAALVGTRA